MSVRAPEIFEEVAEQLYLLGPNKMINCSVLVFFWETFLQKLVKGTFYCQLVVINFLQESGGIKNHCLAIGLLSPQSASVSILHLMSSSPPHSVLLSITISI